MDAFTDLVAAIAAAVGAWVAWSGVGEWKRHLVGKTETDLARRALLALLKYREAINHVRQHYPSKLNPILSDLEKYEFREKEYQTL